jgi:TolB-like protein/cytochrome c-type biogenesis protein CcmH/NrfG
MAVAFGVGGYFFVRQRPEFAAKAVAGARPPAAEAPSAPLSEARKLVAQARALFDDGDQSNHENFFLADDLLKRALSLDATDGEVWAAQAQLSGRVYFYGFDRTTARREAMRIQAERAVKLAPGSIEAQLAMAGYLTFGGGSETASEAVQVLDQLAERAPQNRRIFWTLGSACSVAGKIDESAAAFRRGNLIPGGDPEGLALATGQLFYHGRYAEAEEVVAQSLALRPVGRAQLMDVQIKLNWRGDLEGAAEALARWPAWLRLEDRGGFVASQVWMWRREPDKAIAALNALSQDFLNDSFFVGPKAGLLALAHELADRPQAARQEWGNARRVTERVIAGEPGNKRAAAWRAIALARLGQQAEAEKLLGELEQLRELRSDFWSSGANSALLRIALGRGREVAAKFDADIRNSSVKRPVPSPQAALRFNPVFDPVRETPEFRAWLAAAPAPTNAEKSVAVLAFKNLSGDPAREFFSDGLSEAVTAVLGRVPGLKVVGSSSAFSFKGKSASIPEIARQLGVTHLVEGTVFQEGQTVRITVKLIQADGFQVWVSDKLDRELKNIFALHDEVAGLIAKNLSLKLGAGSAASTAAVDPEAFELYAQARQAWNTRSRAGYARAEELLDRALALAPDFARAHAALADVWLFSGINREMIGRFGQREAAEFNRIEAKAREALRLDPELCEGYAALGGVLMDSWKFDESIRTLRHAIQLNPNYASAHQWLGRSLLIDGRPEEAVASLRRASELDPNSPVILSNYAQGLVYRGSLTEGLAVYERATALNPARSLGFTGRVRALADLGKFTEALNLLELPPEGTSTNSTRLYVLARAGRTSEMETLLAKIATGARRESSLVPPFLIAQQYDQALAKVSANDVSTSSVVDYLYSADFDPVRDDPRFTSLLATLGLSGAHARAQAWRAAHPPEKPATR